MSDSPLNEIELLAASCCGDSSAFAELLRPLAGRINAVAAGIVGPAAAEDAVQDAVLSAWLALPRFRGESRFATWLHTIVVRRCLRLAGAQAQAPASLDDLTTAGVQWADPDWTVDPAAVAARAQQKTTLQSALRGLPLPYRTAVLLHDVEGLSGSEVAAITGVPLGTAKARIRRGRAALVCQLAALDPPLTAEAQWC
ncbi:MAG: sigma-70 family RNA polymerase sigma factor [Mycobacteriales bacterium]